MIAIPDVVNGLFEGFGTFFVYGNVRQILKDKQVKGIWWPAIAFFTAWGYWNIFYYPHLGQWVSFVGGLGVVAMNTWWIVLLFKYRTLSPIAQSVGASV